EVPRTENCPKCQGSGAKPGTSPGTCSTYRGSGQVTGPQNTPFGQMVTSSPCPKCGARGEPLPSPAEDCSGTERAQNDRKINIKIPAGVEERQHLKLRGQGDSAGPKGVSGDLYVVINIQPHRLFQRLDSDLIMETPISFTQAALGADLEVPTLNGRARIKV